MSDSVSPIFIDPNQWRERINQTFSGVETRKKYEQYISQLESTNLPILFDLTSIAEAVQIHPEYLGKIVSRTENFYRCFEIPKRTIGYRRISVPSPTLLYIQRWILHSILERNSPHTNATGFKKDCGIIPNAAAHLNKHAILKLDIADFFPSIKLKRVIATYQAFGYSNKVSYLLGRISCYKNSLPQGAPTSPYLSNLIAKRLDKRLSKLASNRGLAYTRYADDITFSGEYISPKLILIITEILESERFKINKNKTILARGNTKKIVTGISVAEATPHFPKAEKRKLRAESHSLISKGYRAHCEQYNIVDPLYIDRILGKLNFWKQLEPNNKFVNSTITSIRSM